MDSLAARIVDAVPTAIGPILVRDRCGRAEIVDAVVADAVVAECLRRGMEPVVEHVDNARLRALIASTPVDALARWDRDRQLDTGRVSAAISLGGWPLSTDGLPPQSLDAWRAAAGRTETALEDRRVPMVVVAVATADVAAALNMTLCDLDEYVLPGLALTSADLGRTIAPVIDALAAGPTIELQTAAGVLIARRGSRPLLVDDGVIDAADLAIGATVSNLPAGSVYWTVIEGETRGDVLLGDGSVLRFDEDGRVREGTFAGERVAHIGIATNPLVTRTIGWTIVDEHRPGAVFLALGENRYMGGENESAINVDLLPASPTLKGGNVTIVDDGRLVT
jgi:leucyl aminopeptidase (aminopeptidase T)